MIISCNDYGSDVSTKIIAGGKTFTARPYIKGDGGEAVIIKKGQLFQGRVQGGPSRAQIFGSGEYGSGYPGGGVLRGTSGRGFPFYFWPIAWSSPYSIHPGDAYLHPTEYGLTDNPSRSNSSSRSTFHVLTDEESAFFLLSTLSVCGPYVSLSSAKPIPYLQYAINPLPEQALQYYRASSAVLTLDGYNNTAIHFPQNSNPTNALLPSDTDVDLLGCLNRTIGHTLLLVDLHKPLSYVNLFLVLFFSILVGTLLIYCFAGLCLRNYLLRHKSHAGNRSTEPSYATSARGQRGIECRLPPPQVDVKEPPKAAIAPEALHISLSDHVSRRRDSSVDSRDSAGLVNNAESFAGMEDCEYAKRQTSQNATSWWSWTPWSVHNRHSENIEMGTRPCS